MQFLELFFDLLLRVENLLFDLFDVLVFFVLSQFRHLLRFGESRRIFFGFELHGVELLHVQLGCWRRFELLQTSHNGCLGDFHHVNDLLDRAIEVQTKAIENAGEASEDSAKEMSLFLKKMLKEKSEK